MSRLESNKDLYRQTVWDFISITTLTRETSNKGFAILKREHLLSCIQKNYLNPLAQLHIKLNSVAMLIIEIFIIFPRRDTDLIL